MSAEEAAWAATGAPYPLAEVPKPIDLEPAADTTLITIPDLKLTAFVGAMREIADRLEVAAHQAALGPAGDFERFDDLEKALGTWAQDIHDAINEIAPTDSTTRVEYTVRWDDGGEPLLHTPKRTLGEAREVLDAVESIPGVIVQRTVTAWVEVA